MTYNRPRYGTPRAKQLEELKLKEGITISIRVKERYIKGCYKANIKWYFIIKELCMLKEIFQKQYNQRKLDNQEEFNKWMDKNVIPEYLFILRQISYIKGALIITNKDLKK